MSDDLNKRLHMYQDQSLPSQLGQALMFELLMTHTCASLVNCQCHHLFLVHRHCGVYMRLLVTRKYLCLLYVMLLDVP